MTSFADSGKNQNGHHPMSSWKVFGVVLLMGFVAYFATFSIEQVANIFWVDFLHSNPDRSRANALSMIAWTPAFAGYVTIFIAPLPVLIVASGIALTNQLLRCIPWQTVVWFGFMGALANSAQFAHFGDDVPATYVKTGPVHFFFRLLAMEIPFLLACWFGLENHSLQSSEDERLEVTFKCPAE